MGAGFTTLIDKYIVENNACKSMSRIGIGFVAENEGFVAEFRAI